MAAHAETCQWPLLRRCAMAWSPSLRQGAQRGKGGSGACWDGVEGGVADQVQGSWGGRGDRQRLGGSHVLLVPWRAEHFAMLGDHGVRASLHCLPGHRGSSGGGRMHGA